MKKDHTTGAIHTQIYIPANRIFSPTLAKSYAYMNTKWQKMLYLICCLNLLMTERNGELGRRVLTVHGESLFDQFCETMQLGTSRVYQGIPVV